MYNSRVWFAAKNGLFQWDLSGYGADLKRIDPEVMSLEMWRELAMAPIHGVAFNEGYLFYATSIYTAYLLREIGDGYDIMPLTFLPMKNPCLDDYESVIYEDMWTGQSMRWPIVSTDVCSSTLPKEEGDNRHRKMMCNDTDYVPYHVELYNDEERRTSYRVARVEWDERTADHVSVTFVESYFGDEKDIGYVEAVSSVPFAFPGGRSNQTVIVKLEGYGTVHEVRLATSRRELISQSNRSVES